VRVTDQTLISHLLKSGVKAARDGWFYIMQKGVQMPTYELALAYSLEEHAAQQAALALAAAMWVGGNDSDEGTAAASSSTK
jgi:hypothetical protein